MLARTWQVLCTSTVVCVVGGLRDPLKGDVGLAEIPGGESHSYYRADRVIYADVIADSAGIQTEGSQEPAGGALWIQGKIETETVHPARLALLDVLDSDIENSILPVNVDPLYSGPI